MNWQETAPAKLNLTLRVVGRRADGYRLLDSLVVFASVEDRLSWQPDAKASGLQLSVSGPQAAGLRALLAEENLVWRAAQALSARHGRVLAGRLSLDKHLPVSSGIGGGSADAAACLRLLARAWDIAGIPADLAVALGADVPVCLAKRAAHMTGIGERLRFLPPPPPLPALLVNPGGALSTAAIFHAHAAAKTAFTAALPVAETWPCDAAGLATLMAAGGNDLTAAALNVQPAIGAVLSELASAPGAAGAAMSGSGATCFALFDSAQACAAAGDRLRARHGDWWVMPANLIG